LLGWIPQECCVTDLGGDRLRIEASGQVVARRGYSPDGKYYRCACHNIAGQWVVSPGANTRCLFTPMQGS
jgi:hypothetical protein